MDNKKYNQILTIIIIIVVIAIIGILSFLGYNLYKKYSSENEASTILEQFDTQLINEGEFEEEIENNPEENSETGSSNTNNKTGSSSSKSFNYKGLNVVGKIKIPKTKIEYPIIETVTKTSIEVGVAILFGTGLNQPGNTVIIGHNFKNGQFFSNNKKLANGDIIYITDSSGYTVTYKIYNIFITTPEDSDYMVRNTNGKREISLSSCTDDSKSRLIVCAREE